MKKTLERLVDFDRINDLKTRLSVGAVGVTSGNFKYFDNYEFKQLGKKIGPEHIMASGALPPGFPAVFIDGEYYWDGRYTSLVNQTDPRTARVHFLLRQIPSTVPGGVDFLGGMNQIFVSPFGSVDAFKDYHGAYAQDSWRVSPKLTVASFN